MGPLTSGSNENIEKYQHFSLRALKLVIQQLNKSKTQRDRRCFLELSDILITSIGTNAIVNQNITPFSFEKLLINLVNQTAKLFAIDSIMSCSMLVKKRLTPLIDHQEASSLLKCLANVLWQITSIFEQKDDHQDWELLVHMRSLSLEMFCISCQNSSSNDPGFVNQVVCMLLATSIQGRLYMPCGQNCNLFGTCESGFIREVVLIERWF